jgi:hypothetical protein
VADVFISYAHQDGELVRELSPVLEAAGYSTWYYEDKGAVGASYLLQIDQEIERCHAVIVLISPDSVDSDQVSKEVIRAHEAKKKFIPVRRGISHAEFQKRQPEWRMAFGAAVSAEVPEDDGARAVGPRILEGLKRLGVEPGGPPALPSSPLRRVSRAVASGAGRDAGIGSAVAAVVGALGLPYTLFHLSRSLTPVAGSPEAWLSAAFPGFRAATTLVNVAGIVQNALLLFGAWLARRRDPRGAPLIRVVAMTMLAAVGLWLLVSLSAFTGDEARAKIADPAARSGLVQATIAAGLIALVPSALVFALFRNARKAT